MVAAPDMSGPSRGGTFRGLRPCPGDPPTVPIPVVPLPVTSLEQIPRTCAGLRAEEFERGAVDSRDDKDQFPSALKVSKNSPPVSTGV